MKHNPKTRFYPWWTGDGWVESPGIDVDGEDFAVCYMETLGCYCGFVVFKHAELFWEFHTITQGVFLELDLYPGSFYVAHYPEDKCSVFGFKSFNTPPFEKHLGMLKVAEQVAKQCKNFRESFPSPNAPVRRM